MMARLLAVLCSFWLAHTAAAFPPAFSEPASPRLRTSSAVTTEPLSFVSSAASGTLQINGTLFLPAKSGSGEELPSVLLVTGSGPNNRYESVLESFFSTEMVDPKPLVDDGFCYYYSLQFQPFYEIAMFLAENGFAVYSYDKRTCTSAKQGCSTVPCTTPGQKSCLNISNIEFADFITDGVNAVNAMRNHPRIATSHVAVAGHSQGTTVAAYVAEKASINRVVLLMGAGSDIAGTFYRQADHLQTLSRNILNESLCDASTATGKGIMEGALANNKLAKETIAAVGPTLDAWAAGSNPFPANAMCRLGIFGSAPCKFYFEWVQRTEPSRVNVLLQALLGNASGRLLAINSPTDLNVAPADFLPLRAMLGKFPTAKHVTVPGITHLLSPADLSSPNVTAGVLQQILSFLQAAKTQSGTVLV